MLGPDARDAIAREVAAGLRPADVARAHSMDPNYLSSLLRDDEDMRARVDSYKELLTLGAQQLVAKTWLAASDALDRIIEISRDRSDRKCYDANVYIMEKVWPTKQVVEQHNTHTLSADLTVKLIESLDAMKQLRPVTYTPENDPHLMEGRDVKYGEDA